MSTNSNRLEMKNRPLARLTGAFLVALIAVAGCGSGSDDQPAAGNAGGNAPSAPPIPIEYGAVSVSVTDYFDQPVAAATVHAILLQNPNSQERVTDAAGKVTFDRVPAGPARLCAHHDVRGGACGPEDPVTVPANGTLTLTRKLGLSWGLPVAAVLDTSVDPGGLSPDGRTLALNMQVAVTQTGWGSTSFNGHGSFSVADCVARSAQELAELGPRCIGGAGGTDASYVLAAPIGQTVSRTINQPRQPATIGLLFDQSAAVLDREKSMVEARLFAAKILADKILPDTGLLLAAFADNDAAGVKRSLLPQTPVTFLPLQNPGPLVARPETFAELDGLMAMSGGIAPLYAAVLSAIDFVADRAIPGTQRALVVMANGRDDACGVPTECKKQRNDIAVRARDRNVKLFLLAPDLIVQGYSAADAAIVALAQDTSAPLVIAPWLFGEPLELVQQLLSDSFTVEDVQLQLRSETAGAFQSGAIVTGHLIGFNINNCPFDCYPYVMPFSVRVP